MSLWGNCVGYQGPNRWLHGKGICSADQTGWHTQIFTKTYAQTHTQQAHIPELHIYNHKLFLSHCLSSSAILAKVKCPIWKENSLSWCLRKNTHITGTHKSKQVHTHAHTQSSKALTLIYCCVDYCSKIFWSQSS